MFDAILAIENRGDIPCGGSLTMVEQRYGQTDGDDDHRSRLKPSDNRATGRMVPVRQPGGNLRYRYLTELDVGS